MPSIFRLSGLLTLLFLLSAPHLLCAQAEGNAQATHLVQLGADAMRQGNVAEAERYFTQATRAEPQSADAFLDLGLVQLRRGKVDAAEKSLARAIALNPELQGAHMFHGIAKYQMHEADAASADLREEIKLQPQNVEALTWLGIIELGAGDADKAAPAARSGGGTGSKGPQPSLSARESALPDRAAGLQGALSARSGLLVGS